MMRKKILSSWLVLIFALSSVICPCLAMAIDSPNMPVSHDAQHMHHQDASLGSSHPVSPDTSCLDDCQDGQVAVLAIAPLQPDIFASLIGEVDSLETNIASTVTASYISVSGRWPPISLEYLITTPVSRFDRLLN